MAREITHSTGGLPNPVDHSPVGLLAWPDTAGSRDPGQANATQPKVSTLAQSSGKTAVIPESGIQL